MAAQLPHPAQSVPPVPKVKPVPEHFHTVTPYLVVRGVPAMIEFLKRGFGAEPVEQTRLPDGTICHAVVRIGDSMVMLGESNGSSAPMTSMLYLYVPDVDATYARAIAASGRSIMSPTTQFYGDRTAGVKDACDNQWWIASRVEEVSAEELTRRAAAQKRG